MKISLRKNRYNIKKIIAILVIAVLLIFLLNFFKIELRNFFYQISAPIQKTLWRAGNKISDFFEGLAKTSNFKNELDVSKTKNQELTYQIASLTELKKENDSLRKALDIGLNKEFNLIFCRIVAKDISQDFILIDKGKKDGVLKDMPLITPEKVLVGRVYEVYENQSKILLISNKKSSLDAKVSGKDITGVVKGQGNFNILFDLISRDQGLTLDEVVISSNMGGIFPEGLLIGKIKEVKNSDLEAYQKADLEPFFDIKMADILFLIKER